MAELLTAAATVAALTTAWEELLADDQADHELSAGTQHFADAADANIDELSKQFAAGTYRPGSLAWVPIPKPDGGTRELQIPRTRDRVVEKAIADVLSPVIDALLGPSAYAYRPGIGVADAVQRVVSLRREGLRWVARTDIDECFPSIDVDRIRQRLREAVPDVELLALLDALLARDVAHPGGTRRLRGLAQGSPLSPMLANLFLEQLDEGIRAAGFPLVRYGDDLALFAASAADARHALAAATVAVEEIGMTLGSGKTEVMSFDEGFCFLGEDFGPRYPPLLDEHRVEVPDTKTLYVALPGAAVRLEAGRITVTDDDHELLSVPSGHVERMVLFGAVGLSAGARSWALTNHADVVFASQRGAYLGHLADGTIRNIDRLRRHLAAADDPRRYLPIAQAIVRAKIAKQIVLVQRQIRRGIHEDLADTVASLRNLFTMLPDATTRDEVMGLEGAAANGYFRALGAMVAEPLRFHGRSRRRPLDLVNAALSFAYTVLLGEAVTALTAAGLDPAIGLLHTPTERRPSLALDLIEEFRPYVADQIVLTAATNGSLLPEHERTEDGRAGVLLTKAGRTVIIDAYERRMLRTTRGALPNFTGSVRRHLYRQAQRIAGWIENGQPWTGLSWR